MSFFKKFWATFVVLVFTSLLAAVPAAGQSMGGVYPGPVSPGPSPSPGGESGVAPSPGVPCLLEQIRPGSEPRGWNHHVQVWVGEPALFRVLTDPDTAVSYAELMSPVGAGGSVEYTVFGFTGVVRGTSPTGSIAARRGDYFDVTAKIFYPTVNGNVVVTEKNVVVGDIRLNSIEGDPRKLGLVPVGPLTNLWVANLVRTRQGFQVGVADQNVLGPGMAPDSRVAVEVQEVVPKGAEGKVPFLACRLEGLGVGDLIRVLGFVANKTYDLRVYTYIPLLSRPGALGTLGDGLTIAK